MEVTNEIIYKKYSLSKTEVQLESVMLEEINTIKRSDEPEETNFYVQLDFGTKTVLVDNKTVDGYLKAKVNLIPYVKEEKDTETHLEITMVYKGRFTSQSDTQNGEIEKWVEYQITPLLLPYVRTFIADLTTRMSYDPVIIPTMDVLESLKQNHFTEQMAGDSEDVDKQN